MERFPQDIINKIFSEFTILELKKVCTGNIYLQKVIYNYSFWKNYIQKYFVDFEPSDEKSIFNQIKYLFQITYVKQIKVHHIKKKLLNKYFQNGDYGGQKLFELIKQIKIKDGDIINTNNDQNLDFWEGNCFRGSLIFYKNKFLKLEIIKYKNFGKFREFKIPKEVNLINEIPIEYFYNYNTILFIKFYLDVSEYIDQIERNLLNIENRYETNFTHKYGRKFKILYEGNSVKNSKIILKDILKGYFSADCFRPFVFQLIKLEK